MQIESSTFSKAAYLKLLKAFSEASYQFELFSTHVPLNGTVLLRHDVDFSITRALLMARMDFSLNIRSTFFFLPTSNFYNLFSASSVKIVDEIHSMGHDICLHVDKVDIVTINDFEQAMTAFQHRFPYANNWLISRHRPNLLAQTPWLPPNCMDTYFDLFFKTIEYASDSRGVWKYGHPILRDSFSERRSFQLLTHPVWWTTDGKQDISQKDIIIRAISENYSDELISYNF